jgi:guanine deaminase
MRVKLRVASSYVMRRSTQAPSHAPMGMAAAYWAGMRDIFYASTNDDALRFGSFDDSMILAELKKSSGQRSVPSRQIMRLEAVMVWEEYQNKSDRVPY